MKFRIKEIDDKFIIQRKSLFFWNDYKERCSGADWDWVTVEFNSFKSASFLLDKILQAQ